VKTTIFAPDILARYFTMTKPYRLGKRRFCYPMGVAAAIAPRLCPTEESGLHGQESRGAIHLKELRKQRPCKAIVFRKSVGWQPRDRNAKETKQ
jgi:hypothetical protein